MEMLNKRKEQLENLIASLQFELDSVNEQLSAVDVLSENVIASVVVDNNELYSNEFMENLESDIKCELINCVNEGLVSNKLNALLESYRLAKSVRSPYHQHYDMSIQSEFKNNKTWSFVGYTNIKHIDVSNALVRKLKSGTYIYSKDERYLIFD